MAPLGGFVLNCGNNPTSCFSFIQGTINNITANTNLTATKEKITTTTENRDALINYLANQEGIVIKTTEWTNRNSYTAHTATTLEDRVAVLQQLVQVAP